LNERAVCWITVYHFIQHWDRMDLMDTKVS